MKKISMFVLGSMLLLLASCDSSNSTNDLQTNDLQKIVTIRTNSSSPSSTTTNIKRFVNFEVVSDSTFDFQNQFIEKKVIITNGLTKTLQTFSNTGELTAHSEENYDSQGRLVGRHTFLPPSALYFTYVYNSDGTVSSKYYNELDGQTTTFRTFTKDSNGLLFRENGIGYNPTTGLTEDYEVNADIQNQKLISVTQSAITTSFQYYPNPKPANLLKSVNLLNNEIIMGNTLRNLAERGNYYYKVNDSDITTFNSDNYKTYYKSVNINTSVVPNSTSTIEQFYFYN